MDIIVDKLEEENFILYAMKAYKCTSNRVCLSMSDFHEDLKRVNYIKKLFTRYKQSGEIKERLVLNHIVIFYNVFGPLHGTRILFYKLEEEYHSALKTFLLYLSYMPEVVYGVKNGENILSSDIPVDFTVVKQLRAL